MSRRTVFGLFGAAALVGCGGGGGSDSATTASTGTTGTTGTGTTGTGSTTGGSSSASCVLIPEETQGPYPLWNDIASAAAYTRQDITEGKTGVPLDLLLTIVNVNSNCAPITNALVYVWHCDKDGAYSGYNQQGANTVGATFCRGVQMTDSSGLVRFTTIYPGWYAGRITHVHFRVYLGNNLEATSQLAFPQDLTAAVYATSEYASRGQNTSVRSFAADNVFSDGETYQLCAMSQNSATAGYNAALTVGVAL